MSFESIDKTIIEVPAPKAGGSSNTSERFDQEKKEWASELDDEATAYICDYFDVSAEDVTDFESLTDGEYSHDDLHRPVQLLDYAGMDRLVDCHDRYISVALRFRPQNEEYDVDFSYCVDNGTANQTAEKTKHLTAYRLGGVYPTVYGFGIVDEETDTFDEFHLIEMREFLGCVEVGALNPDGPRTRAGGVKALYYSIDELRGAGCILQSWGDAE